jgi:hypothetical protein
MDEKPRAVSDVPLRLVKRVSRISSQGTAEASESLESYCATRLTRRPHTYYDDESVATNCATRRHCHLLDET